MTGINWQQMADDAERLHDRRFGLPPRKDTSLGLGSRNTEENAETPHFAIDYAIDPTSGFRRLIRREVNDACAETESQNLEAESKNL
jgi:hypothetical protein